MNYQSDWLMRQIEIFIQAIARLLFNKDAYEYDVRDEGNLTDADILHRRLTELIGRREICAAEDLLYESTDPSEPGYLEVAVAFYQELNKLSDDELAAARFSRGEIRTGLSDVLEKFGIDIPMI